MSHTHSAICPCASESKDVGLSESLYSAINHNQIIAYNCKSQNEAKRLFRPHDQRLESILCQSEDGDCELIIHIPFNVNVKLKSFSLITPDSQHAPLKVKLFINRDDLSPSNINDFKSVEEIILAPDTYGEYQYFVKFSKFQNVSSLIMFFCSNQSGNSEVVTELNYIGLRGQISGHRREAVNVVYEAYANPADHKNLAEQKMNQHVM